MAADERPEFSGGAGSERQKLKYEDIYSPENSLVSKMTFTCNVSAMFSLYRGWQE